MTLSSFFVAATPSHSCTHTVILCPQLSLVNGIIFKTSNTVSSQAFHQCNVGFQLNGLSVRECLTTGQWSGEMPTCIRKFGITYNTTSYSFCAQLLCKLKTDRTNLYHVNLYHAI